jgi:hypothetical protein
MITRGGLLKPSDALYVVCCHAHVLYKKLADTEENKKLLLSTSNPISVYVEALMHKLESCQNTMGLLETKCGSNHSFSSYVKKIGKTMFNLFAKNLISEENSKIHKSRKRASKSKTQAARKLKKLSSE